jgi:hypothetical protein
MECIKETKIQVKKAFEQTEAEKAKFDSIISNPGNILIIGAPGSGKTVAMDKLTNALMRRREDYLLVDEGNQMRINAALTTGLRIIATVQTVGHHVSADVVTKHFPIVLALRAGDISTARFVSGVTDLKHAELMCLPDLSGLLVVKDKIVTSFKLMI